MHPDVQGKDKRQNTNLEIVENGLDKLKRIPAAQNQAHWLERLILESRLKRS